MINALNGSGICAPEIKHDPKNDNLVLNFLVRVSECDPDQEKLSDDDLSMGKYKRVLHCGWIGEFGVQSIIYPITGHEDIYFTKPETEHMESHRERMKRDPQLPKVYESTEEAMDGIETHKKVNSGFNIEYLYDIVPFRSNNENKQQQQ